MAKTQTLSLGDRWNHFIAAQVADGRYASASEVVRDALRLLEEKHAHSRLELLRAALIEGEESGDGGPLEEWGEALADKYFDELSEAMTPSPSTRKYSHSK